MAKHLGLIDLGNDTRGGADGWTIQEWEGHFPGLLDARPRAHRHRGSALCGPRQLTGQSLWCPILDGCNAVVNSPYSRVFGVPMSYFGFIYFLYMFALAVRLVFEPFAQSLRLRAILYAAMGAISSMYFIYLQLRFIRELCSYCLISAVVSVLLVFAALWHFLATRHPVAKKLARSPGRAEIPTSPR
jgi:uncharacterized membrane protein